MKFDALMDVEEVPHIPNPKSSGTSVPF